MCKQCERKLTEVIGNVPADGDFMAESLKVGSGSLGLAKVDDLTPGQ